MAGAGRRREEQAVRRDGRMPGLSLARARAARGNEGTRRAPSRQESPLSNRAPSVLSPRFASEFGLRTLERQRDARLVAGQVGAALRGREDRVAVDDGDVALGQVLGVAAAPVADAQVQEHAGLLLLRVALGQPHQQAAAGAPVRGEIVEVGLARDLVVAPPLVVLELRLGPQVVEAVAALGVGLHHRVGQRRHAREEAGAGQVVRGGQFEVVDQRQVLRRRLAAVHHAVQPDADRPRRRDPHAQMADQAEAGILDGASEFAGRVGDDQAQAALEVLGRRGPGHCEQRGEQCGERDGDIGSHGVLLRFHSWPCRRSG